MALSPDVCWTPTPSVPPGAPAPYPNLADLGGAKKVTSKVLVRDKPCLVEGSYIPRSSGDEAGCNTPIPNGKMGVKSRTQMSKVEFSSHSGKVKMEGKGVIFHTASTKHSETNTMGKHGTPSQSVVFAD